MSDIVERLRKEATAQEADWVDTHYEPGLLVEAADRIEADAEEIKSLQQIVLKETDRRLRAENKRLIEPQSREGRHALRVENDQLRARLAEAQALMDEAIVALGNSKHPGADEIPASKCPVCYLMYKLNAAIDKEREQK